MLVRDIMTTPVITVTEDTPISHAAELLEKHHLTGMPVVEAEKVIGIITEGDFILKSLNIHLPSLVKILGEAAVRRHAKEAIGKEYERLTEAKVKDIMTKDVITISSDRDITEAARQFIEKKVNPLPVIDGFYNLVGIVSRADLLRFAVAAQNSEKKA